ncbi:MAG: efflux RND transporter permease subunit [Pseudomonadota bacterium]
MMRALARLSITKPLYTWLLILFSLFGGAAGYLSVGKLEDPVFTLKQALVITPYPGASASEVAIEVTEPLESEIQQMGEVDEITSRSLPGLSVVEVVIRDNFDGGDLPQIWDDLRDRVDNARADLPAGALPSDVNDDFGDVFGLYYAVTTPGYSDADIHEIATFLRREVLTVDGVSNAQVLGLPEEAIFVEPDSRVLTQAGLAPGLILDALGDATAIVPTGSVGTTGRELSVDAPSPGSGVGLIGGVTFGVGGEVIDLRDIAEVSRGRVEEPSQIIRHNGAEAFTLGIAGLTSRNIVDVGAAVEARLDAVADRLPLGVEVQPIYEQHRVVDEANQGFLLSLALSVGVVIAVLALFMGWRAALVVGITLLLTVTATFFGMFLTDTKVERISLGALIIAMGMLVDNAIVVAESMQQRMRQGVKAVDAAEEAVGRTGVPLLGATIIGIMAFAGIGLSPDASGEFLFSLFSVIAISLLLSWILAVTVTPLLSAYIFTVGGLKEGEDAYGGRIFRAYGWLVGWTLRLRWLVIVGLIGITVACIGAFAGVKQQFFPPAMTPLFYLEYKGAQGGAIQTTSEDLAVIEEWLLERDDVAAVTATAGAGLTRFLLTYEPEAPEPTYGELVIRAKSQEAIPSLRAELDLFVARALPWAQVQTRRIIYGPAVPADIEARFSGPDPDVLRALAQETKARLQDSTDLLHSEAIDWREREAVLRPDFAEARGQALGIAREDVATAVALATDGVSAATYRERDRLIPVIVRTPRAEIATAGGLLDQPVWSEATGTYLPLEQVIDGFEVLARDTLIERRDRVPTITVQANVVDGLTPPTVFAEIRPVIEAIPLPPGYALEWGGEFESAGEAQQSLGRQMPLSFGVMLLITILLFGKLRQTAVIWTVVPMAVNGVALGLLFTGLPFSFTALLGLLSLSGMLIKNAIVLVEEIDSQKDEGKPQSEAVVAASVSRMRPVLLAAATTILGMTPLLTDTFFAAMAVTIMAGLGFASILTLIGVPALYHTYLRKERRAEKAEREEKAKKRDERSDHGKASEAEPAHRMAAE